MDINRQISAEKYVDGCIESLGLVFWNVHKECPLYLLLNNARIIFQILSRLFWQVLNRYQHLC